MNHPLAGLFILALLSTGAALAQSCPHRGQLDDLYCDADRDMVADAPTDKSKWKNPSTLIFTYTPIEDPAVYQKIFSKSIEHRYPANTQLGRHYFRFRAPYPRTQYQLSR